jgi:hypothetical protein
MREGVSVNIQQTDELVPKYWAARYKNIGQTAPSNH